MRAGVVGNENSISRETLHHFVSHKLPAAFKPPGAPTFLLCYLLIPASFPQNQINKVLYITKHMPYCAMHESKNDYGRAVRQLHDLGVMVNGSFVFGMDNDDASVFGRTVEWAINQGIETATFHILTPYPGTPLHSRMDRQGRILHRNWDLYDTRHCVFQPAKLTPEQLESGYWRAYKDFYGWGSIIRGAATKKTWPAFLRHLAYSAGWKKLEPMWDLVIRSQRVASMLPWLERILGGFESSSFGVGLQGPKIPGLNNWPAFDIADTELKQAAAVDNTNAHRAGRAARSRNLPFQAPRSESHRRPLLKRPA
jgi:hypothetical protein